MEDGLREADESAAARAGVDRKRQGRTLRCRIARREQRGDMRVIGQAFARLPQRCLIHLVHPRPRQPIATACRQDSLFVPGWQHRPMARPRPDRVHLRRIDPDRRMWRFYSLALQPTLLGGVDLVRRWGRTGTVGSSLIQAFPDEPSAQAALDTLAERKRRRGYT